MGSFPDYITQYLEYTDKTEVPVIFSRWSAIAGLGAFLGRSCYLPLGHFKIYPNMYCMFIGTAGSRKSTAISIQKNLLIGAGYETIAADKSSKEKFLLDLAGEINDPFENIGGGNGNANKQMEDFLWTSPGGISGTSEILIAADEFNNFLGNGNIEFLSLLGVLWDYNGVYKNRIKTGKSVCISNPTVSILAGNTPTGFHLAFPPEALGQGFFSRLLLIHGEPRDVKYTFPEEPSVQITDNLKQALLHIKESVSGKLDITEGARKILDSIYKESNRVDDARFDSYNTRRFTHLLKLCIVCYASRTGNRGKIDSNDVIYANTVLSHAELFMPKALGGFGKARNSDIAHRVEQLVSGVTGRALDIEEIWKHVSGDLEKMADLAVIVTGLVQAKKIQAIPGRGFLGIKKLISENSAAAGQYVDFSLLTNEERNMSL